MPASAKHCESPPQKAFSARPTSCQCPSGMACLCYRSWLSSIGRSRKASLSCRYRRITTMGQPTSAIRILSMASAACPFSSVSVRRSLQGLLSRKRSLMANFYSASFGPCIGFISCWFGTTKASRWHAESSNMQRSYQCCLSPAYARRQAVISLPGTMGRCWEGRERTGTLFLHYLPQCFQTCQRQLIRIEYIAITKRCSSSGPTRCYSLFLCHH